MKVTKESRKRHTLERLEQLLKEKGISEKEIISLLDGKQKKFLPKLSQPKTKSVYKFGIVSDTHLVSRACALKELHAFYKRCEAEGITEIVHSGDFLDGQGVYHGQMNELLCFGLDAHLEYAVNNYPRFKGGRTYCISGNHDESYKKLFGAEILKLLAERRDDIVYLGMYDATVQLNGVYIGLHHGAGGPSYATSYKLQKYVEKIGAGQKPQIYILGHYHESFYMFYRNIHAFLPGAWQKPTDFSVRHGFRNLLGGWIVEVEIANDAKNSITRISPTFIPFY